MPYNSEKLLAKDQASNSNLSLQKIYNDQVKDLSMNIPLLGTLENADFTSRKRSRICGSSVSVELNVFEDKIVDFRQTVRACLLGSCSASIFARNVIGSTSDEISVLYEQVRDMLLIDDKMPEGKWDDYRILSTARMEKSRHASILLVIEATLSALEKR